MSGYLLYRGVHGTIEELENGAFAGHLKNVLGWHHYNASTYGDLVKVFEHIVNDYLSDQERRSVNDIKRGDE